MIQTTGDLDCDGDHGDDAGCSGKAAHAVLISLYMYIMSDVFMLK